MTYRDGDDRWNEGKRLYMIGLAMQEAGQFEDAVNAYTPAAAIFNQLRDFGSEARTLTLLGHALQSKKLFMAAIEVHARAAEIFRNLKDGHKEGGALSDLFLAQVQAGEFNEARRVAVRAHAAFLASGDSGAARKVREWLISLGDTDFDQG